VTRLAFLTGSHAYGKPTDGSDVDLVVRLDEDTRKKLVEIFCPESEREAHGYPELQFKSGKLNIILCSTDASFDAWLDGTKKLIAEAPVTRDRAVEVIKPLLELAGAA
jgi:hypothetical protein